MRGSESGGGGGVGGFVGPGGEGGGGRVGEIDGQAGRWRGGRATDRRAVVPPRTVGAGAAGPMIGSVVGRREGGGGRAPRESPRGGRGRARVTWGGGMPPAPRGGGEPQQEGAVRGRGRGWGCLSADVWVGSGGGGGPAPCVGGAEWRRGRGRGRGRAADQRGAAATPGVKQTRPRRGGREGARVWAGGAHRVVSAVGVGCHRRCGRAGHAGRDGGWGAGEGDRRVGAPRRPRGLVGSAAGDGVAVGGVVPRARAGAGELRRGFPRPERQTAGGAGGEGMIGAAGAARPEQEVVDRAPQPDRGRPMRAPRPPHLESRAGGGSGSGQGEREGACRARDGEGGRGRRCALSRGGRGGRRQAGGRRRRGGGEHRRADGRHPRPPGGSAGRPAGRGGRRGGGDGGRWGPVRRRGWGHLVGGGGGGGGGVGPPQLFLDARCQRLLPLTPPQSAPPGTARESWRGRVTVGFSASRMWTSRRASWSARVSGFARVLGRRSLASTRRATPYNHGSAAAGTSSIRRDAITNFSLANPRPPLAGPAAGRMPAPPRNAYRTGASVAPSARFQRVPRSPSVRQIVICDMRRCSWVAGSNPAGGTAFDGESGLLRLRSVPRNRFVSPIRSQIGARSARERGSPPTAWAALRAYRPRHWRPTVVIHSLFCRDPTMLTCADGTNVAPHVGK